MAPRGSGPALRAACESAVKAAAPHAAIAPRAATPTTTTCRTRVAHRCRTCSTRSSASRSDCASGAVATRTSSASNICSASSIASNGSSSPTTPSARMPRAARTARYPRRRCSAARRGRSSEVQPLEPTAERGRDDEHLEPATVRTAGDDLPDRLGAGCERLVRDDEQAVGVARDPRSGWGRAWRLLSGRRSVGGSCTERAPALWERPVRRLWPFGEVVRRRRRRRAGGRS